MVEISAVIEGEVRYFHLESEMSIKAFKKFVIGISSYLPTRTIINFNIYNFLIIIILTIIFMIIAYMIFNRGLRKYSSSNLMISRI